MNSNRSGTLYVVATPIGNLGDMVPRAVEILQSVTAIACEDTRHSKKLLDHFRIDKPLIAYHDHSDKKSSHNILVRLAAGNDIALISDAGTPLISDPGYRLVLAARQQGVTVIPIPGACAAVAALSVAGLPTDKFRFIGSGVLHVLRYVSPDSLQPSPAYVGFLREGACEHVPLELAYLLSVGPLKFVPAAASDCPGLIACPQLNSRFGREPLVY